MALKKPAKKTSSVATKKKANRPLQRRDASVKGLIESSSVWYYWEQDQHFRFTVMTGSIFEKSGINPQRYLGKKRWENGPVPVGDDGKWDNHIALLEAHEPFTDFTYKYVTPHGDLRYFSASGHPVFDGRGRFKGYRGISRDITARVWHERRLNLEHGITRILAESGNAAQAVPLIIRAICESLGWTCGVRWTFDEQHQTLHCAEVWGVDSPDVDEFLATTKRLSPLAVHTSGLAHRVCANGKPQWIPEITQENLFVRAPAALKAGLRNSFAFPIKAGGKVIGVLECFSRNVQKPDNAELLDSARSMGSQIGQFLQRSQAEAALRDSESILHATLEHMDQGVSCFDADLRLVGWNRRFLQLLDFPESLCHKNAVYADFIRYNAQRGEYGPGDVEDLIHQRVEKARRFEPTRFERVRPDGVVLETRRIPLPDGGFVTTYTDITQHKRAEQAILRLGQMYAALSATNEIILRADSPGAIYQKVCEAAVNAGKFICTAVLLPEGDTARMKIAAISGACSTQLRDNVISVDAALSDDRSLIGAVFRASKTCISNDFHNDERTRQWHAVARAAGIAAAAALPIVIGNRAIGVFLFYSDEKNAFDSEIAALLERMAENVGFGIQGLAHEAERRQGELALRASEEKYRAILENIEDAYYEVDVKGNLVLFNPAFCRLLNYSADELVGLNNREFMTPKTAAYVYKIFNEAYRTGVSSRGYDIEMTRKNGNQILVETSVHLIKNADGQPVGFRGISRDVTERRKTEQALRTSETRFRVLTELSSDWYWELDSEFRVIRIDGRPGKNKETVERNLIGKRPWECDSDAEFEGGLEGWRKLLEAHQPYRDLVSIRRMDNGKVLYINQSFAPIFDDNGQFTGYRGVSREITKQKIAEERIQHLATHDGLTGLPNRVMFAQVLNLAIATAQRYHRKFALLFIDLDRFKVINDTLGHEAGDVLLKEMAVRLKDCLRSSDLVARLGGDEFVVLIQEVNEPNQVATVARKILSTVIKPTVVLGHECRVTTSIGISLYPDDALDEQSLMKNADMAMYLAKEEGKNNFQFYSKKIKTQSLERMALETNLRSALERDEFSLHYQAKLDFKTGAITGVEALLRWQNPELGTVSPAQLIPVAEETGLIVQIGKWVLKTACTQNMAWQRQGLPPICMAVNLSPRQFSDPDLLKDIAAVLEESGMPAELLELEITESMVMHNTEQAVKLLTEIKRMGMRLAIDDFGTGYSSLAQLKRFPIDTLKVDRSFIRDIPRDAEDKAITEAIIAMGKSLSLTIVAEGVETEEQAQFLRTKSCDEMQGYYFSKPVVPERFAELLSEHLLAERLKQRS